jgi:hypothetical protein
MDPSDPLDAQQVVVEYARLLERDLADNRYPARVDSLPYAKPIIKSAIQTSVQSLTRSGQLTDDLREFLETAYVSLAEYIDAELAHLLVQYRAAASELAAGATVHDRTATIAWRTVAGSSALAGDVARAITDDAEALREEFRSLIATT